MGIPNLLRILKNISKRQSLSSYKGKKAGIDGYTWLHRSLYCIGEGILKNPIDITRCINFFTKKLQLLLRNEITPIFIFDGDKLPMKINEEDKREEKRKEYEKEAENLLKMNNIYGAIFKKVEAFDVTPEFAYEFMKILKNYNVEYYVAPYEADAQLAYLSYIDYIDFIITEDSDLVAYGCKCVLFKLGNLKDEPIDVGEEILWENVKNCKEIRFKNFSQDKFLSFCILCGCDYLKIKGVGPNLSNEALNKFDDYNKFLGYVFNKNCIQGSIIETINQYERTFLTFRYQVVYCPIEKKMKYFHDINEHSYSFLDKYKNDLSFLGILDFDNIDEYILGEINPITKKQINENNDNFYIANSIYDINYTKKSNNQKTINDDLYIKDDNSVDSISDCENKKNISQYNFKFGKNKGGKKKKKSEKPKDQYGIESFFLNNNAKKEKKKNNPFPKKIGKKEKKKNYSDLEENKEEEEKSKEFNDENNVNNNIFSNYSFNLANCDNKRTINDLDFYKSNDNNKRNYSKNFQSSGLHLSNTEFNSCYNPFTQYKKENKTKENKKLSINSRQKKLYNKFNLKFKDEDEEEEEDKEKKINFDFSNVPNLDLGNIDNYNFSETILNSTKEELTLPSSSGELAKKNENSNKVIFVDKPGNYMESFNDTYSKKIKKQKREKFIQIEDEKEDNDDKKNEDKNYAEDNSFNFDNYKNTIFSLDKF